jgi:ankyrin repeat protein
VPLLDSPLDINAQNGKGDTPYHYAVSGNDYHLILLFRDSSKYRKLDRSSTFLDPRLIKNKDGKSPLDLAIDEQAKLLVLGMAFTCL